jgi:hypothetical protein
MKVRYQRRNNVILDVRSVQDRTNGETVDPIEPPRVFKSINGAKRESVLLQKKYGAGCLRVDKDAPPLYPSRLAYHKKTDVTKKPSVTASPRKMRLGDALAMVAAAIVESHGQ